MEDFVTFEIANKLKEKGFEWDCYATFDGVGYTTHFCPTISQVLKWLREEYSIHISTKPCPCEDGIMWLYEIRKFNKYISFIIANKTGFIKEEQAAAAGIEYVLDNNLI